MNPTEYIWAIFNHKIRKITRELTSKVNLINVFNAVLPDMLQVKIANLINSVL